MSAHEAEKLATEIIAGGSRFIKVRVGALIFRFDLDRVSVILKWEFWMVSKLN